MVAVSLFYATLLLLAVQTVDTKYMLKIPIRRADEDRVRVAPRAMIHGDVQIDRGLCD
jgi:hypothetical protein